MTEKSIVFTGEQVRATQKGSMTLIHCVMEPQPPEHIPIGYTLDAYDGGPQWNFWTPDYRLANSLPIWECPYGKVGDRLWVQEEYCVGYPTGERNRWTALRYSGCTNEDRRAFYRADGGDPPDEPQRFWYPADRMERWASRLTLEICTMRAYRLQDISLEDARASGIPQTYGEALALGLTTASEPGCAWDNRTSIENFARVYVSLNAKREYSWTSNPWAWAIEFRRVEV